MDVDPAPLPGGPPHTRQSLPSNKLVHYLTKDDVISILGERYASVQREAVEQGVKVTAKYLKQQLLSDDALVEQVRESELGHKAFAKYTDNYMRITRPESKAKGKEVRALMTQPRKGFMGCIATKVKPKDLRHGQVADATALFPPDLGTEPSMPPFEEESESEVTSTS